MFSSQPSWSLNTCQPISAVKAVLPEIKIKWAKSEVYQNIIWIFAKFRLRNYTDETTIDGIFWVQFRVQISNCWMWGWAKGKPKISTSFHSITLTSNSFLIIKIQSNVAGGLYLMGNNGSAFSCSLHMHAFLVEYAKLMAKMVLFQELIQASGSH